MTSPRKRRSLLQTGGALAVAGLAGCLGGMGNDTPDGTTVHTDTTEPKTEKETTDTGTTEGSQALSVEGFRVQSSLLYLNTPDSMQVATLENRQVVFADVRPPADGGPKPDEFHLAIDDAHTSGTLTPGPAGAPPMVHSPIPAYDPEVRETGWIAFEVPNPLDAESVELVYESDGGSVSEPIPSETAAELAAPAPEFELVSLDAPESVGAGDVFDISVTVENVGESDGTFRAVLNETHPTYGPFPMVVRVPAGEQREWRETFGEYASDDTEKYSYDFRSSIEDRDLEVEVEPETTTSG